MINKYSILFYSTYCSLSDRSLWGLAPARPSPCSLAQPERAVKPSGKVYQISLPVVYQVSWPVNLCKVSLLVIYQVSWPVHQIIADQLCLYQVSWPVIYQEVDQLYSRSADQLSIMSADQFTRSADQYSTPDQLGWPEFHQISWSFIYHGQLTTSPDHLPVIRSADKFTISADQLSGQLTCSPIQLTSSPYQLTSSQVSWPVHRISWPVNSSWPVVHQISWPVHQISLHQYYNRPVH
jgi:hypothetical protein